MALGNANTSAQSRGKNKPVVVKRRKEVVAAKNYNSISGSTVQANNTCPATLVVDKTYYHNGSGSVPAVGDIVYSSRRARVPNKFTAGHYKMSAIPGRFGNVQIDSSGVVLVSTACR